ncbi:GNAT family N-acetyltransferase [Chitiniphilus eburneus]|uniref:GNAT family N-acetyltransferase n=1 Tax=Chitiniphilus eburneus TaxID=2571148 RepID=UPI0035D0F021
MERSLRALRIPTARLCVRTLSLADLDALHALARQSSITDPPPGWATSHEHCTAWLDRHVTQLDHFSPAAPTLFLAICLPDGELIGWLGIRPRPSAHLAMPELLYALAPAHRGKGYTSEAIRGATRWFFAQGPVPALMALVKEPDTPSRRVALASGFAPRGHAVCDEGGRFELFVLERPAAVLTLEPVLDEDATALSALLVRVAEHEARHWLDGESPFIPDHHLPAMHRFHRRTGDYRKIVFDGMLAGVVLVSSSGREHARIELLYLDPAHQGLGLGGQVLKRIEEEYPQVHTWSLDTTRHSARNLPFYQRHGYVVTGEDEDEYYLVKHLPGAAGLREGCDFRATNLRGADFNEVDLSQASISNSGMADTCIRNAGLQRLLVTNCNVSDATFGNSRLDGLALHHVSLGGARIDHCHLGWAGERKPLTVHASDLGGSHIVGCNLRDVRIEGCDTAGLIIDGVPLAALQAAYRALHG